MAKRVVYVSFMLHGNMSYDRYTKQTIEESFPRLYRKGVDALLADPSVPAVVDLSGITIRWLDRVAPDVLEGLRLLAKRGQIDIARHAGWGWIWHASTSTPEPKVSSARRCPITSRSRGCCGSWAVAGPC